jgi:ATP-dependent Lon protease
MKLSKLAGVFPSVVPILPLKDMVVFPNVLIPLFLKGTRVIRLAESVVGGENLVALFYQKTAARAGLFGDEISSVGTLARIEQVVRLDGGGVKAIADGLCRVRLIRQVQDDPYLMGEVDIVEEKVETQELVHSLAETVGGLFKLSLGMGKPVGEHARSMIEKADTAGKLADLVAVYLPLKAQVKQSLLENEDPTDRLKKVAHYLAVDLENQQARLAAGLSPQGSPGIRRQGGMVSRQHPGAGRKEPGGAEDPYAAEIQEFHRKVRESGMPEDVVEAAVRELQRLERMPPHSPEYTVSRTYLETLVGLPWNSMTEDNLDIDRSERVLNEDHYDLYKVKDRILEFLAVHKLRSGAKGPILCLVGPPGVGKTSLGKSVARALGRKFIRISLGGVRDEAEIRGHRRTYIGALPGRIIQELRRCGQKNPVFMLDEVDKIGQDFRGDPAGALLEVLDPEQNYAFVDHYLDVPFDLSQVMFIATANQMDPIPSALRDRMEVIRISGYTDEEKQKIAELFLVRKAKEENGVTDYPIEFTSESVAHVIRSYTREAGVRNLERQIGALCRKVAREITQNRPLRTVIDKDAVEELLGPPKFFSDIAEEQDQVGVATGLAWTETGGDIIFIEVSGIRGGKDLVMTGRLGSVMQESVKAALTYLKNTCHLYGLDVKTLTDTDLHVHVPAGAIPKDGPSAGLTIAVALTSFFSGVPVRRDIAMTGEVTLRGRVLPIGGVKEKLLAARRAGIVDVILPEKNRSALRDLPEYVLEEMNIHFVSEVGEAIQEALVFDGEACRFGAGMRQPFLPIFSGRPSEYMVKASGKSPGGS